ncbi:MAG: serine hydrolase [Bacteroidota bacterium]|nr:serine hydrolase [Bacteroidota bacterium]
MKKILKVTGIISAIALIIFLMLPVSYYIRQALRHGTPDIDDYQFFENRTVKANAPKPWKFSPNYATDTIPTKYLADFAKYETVAFLVVKDTAIVSEKYWSGYGERSLSNSFSMSKSIVSLLVGCAISDGYIKSIDQPISDFLPSLPQLKSRQLTLRALLTMSAALNWDEAHSSLFNVTTEAYYGNNLWALMQQMQLKGTPDKEFEYQSGVTQLLAFVLQKAVKKNLSEYASEKIWTPINAETDALWSLDHSNGMEKAYCCFNTNARDFARLGQLVLNKGEWNGRQVVPANYLAEAITPAHELKRADTGEPNRIYGFQFWIMNYKGYTIPYMRGILGQYIFVIPELNAVIVRLGNLRSETYQEPNHCTDDAFIWLDAAFDIMKASPKIKTDSIKTKLPV